MKRLPDFLTIISLAVINIFLLWHSRSTQIQLVKMTATLHSSAYALKTLNDKSAELQTNWLALVKKGNQVGFAGALYGYEAGRQGMDTEKFLSQAAYIFKGTNLPEIHILERQGTNQVELDLSQMKRRL